MTPNVRPLTIADEASDGQSAGAPSARLRRSHRKSRNGCLECKQRHIRCDERIPICVNCELTERVCSFAKPQPSAKKQQQRQRNRMEQQSRPNPSSVISLSPAPDNQSFTSMVQEVGSEYNELSQPSTSNAIERFASGGSLNLTACPSWLTKRFLPTNKSIGNPYQIPSPATPVQGEGASTSSRACHPGLVTVPNTAPKAIFTPQHMILLHNADKVPNFTAHNRSIVDIAVRHVVTSPYLMDEILAFTAFHMSYLYPGSEEHLRHLAAELQNRALTSFTRVTEMVAIDDKATAVPRFLFSAVLGRHALADTLTYCNSDFHTFIDRLIECMNLNRGVMTVTPKARCFFVNTEVEPFLNVTTEGMQKVTSRGHECDNLQRVIDESDLNDRSKNACLQAIETLQTSFDLCQGLEIEEYSQAASVFSVRVEASYLEVLRKHRPEALVILAYYGVLLSRCRHFWAFANAGPSLVGAIAARLSNYWQEALVWPLQAIELERSSEP